MGGGRDFKNPLMEKVWGCFCNAMLLCAFYVDLFLSLFSPSPRTKKKTHTPIHTNSLSRFLDLCMYGEKKVLWVGKE